LAAAVLGACGKRGGADYVVLNGFAQGSTYHFVVKCADSTGMQRSIDSLLAAVDASMSLYQPNSLINRLNRNETDSVDEYIAYCIEQAAKVSELSGGEYDITIAPITEAWGFAGKNATEHPDVDSLLQYVGWRKIRVENGRLIKDNPNMRIDLNSIAQGLTADLLGRLMESRGATDYLMEIGGEIFCRGVNPRGEQWVVGIDKPEEGNNLPGNNLQARIAISGQGLATSGNYRKYYTDESGHKVVHTVSALTGMSRISNLLSATVVADNATLADVYGTMFMILGLDRSIEFLTAHPEIGGYLVYSDHDGNFRTWVSPSLASRIVE
jgi:thiamine biosynthesis lipoprotein